ncbi:glycosyltransferase family A protein [Bacteroides bouchesdurhonensis]
MKIVVLLSCMHQDKSIIQKSNIQTDVVVINQCDEDVIERGTFVDKFGKSSNFIFVSTTERGLARSRNMAISFAEGYDICLISDDDELFADGYEKTIIDAYVKRPQEDLICFDFKGNKNHFTQECRMGFKMICSSSSIQVSFKRDQIINNSIKFDVKMGSGTGNGPGEEIKFMMDCRRKRLNMYFVPIIITELLPGPSSWFKGRDAKYVRDAGWIAHRAMGTGLGLLYIHYHIARHYDRYKMNFSFIKLWYLINKGFWEKR